jgi:serine/threonine protein kinase
MASYTRLGSYLLASELTSDPSGKVQRGLTLLGSGFDHHKLIRTFSDELMEAGLGTKLGDAQRVVELLAGIRGFGANYHVETGRPGYVVCDYIPGRSLAQVLKKTREEQIPLGVDHALSVLQGMAQSIIQLHGKGIHHGTLSTHSIWVSYEGATDLLDAPYAAILHTLLPKARGLEAALAPYRNATASSPLQQDLFALGAVLFELLTLEKLPAGPGIPAALASATLKAAQEDGPIPAEIIQLLNRLLLVDAPFTTSAAFNESLEKVLYDGEYSPTTFNMAFFMHTLFREEAESDAQAMKGDQSADYTPFLTSDTGSRTMLEPTSNSNVMKYAVIGGGIVVVLFGALLLSNRANSRRNADLQEKIVALQRENAANDAKLLDLNKAQEDQKRLQDALSKKAVEGKTVEERAKAKKDLEEAKQKTDELARQREEALKKRQELSTRTQTMAQAAPAPQPLPQQQEPAKIEPPKAEPPKPAPAPVAAPPKAAQQASTEVSETFAAITKKVPPVAPRIANKAFLPAHLREGDIKVSLKVFVSAQGSPLKVVILNGIDGPLGYNDAAQTAALNSQYVPATKNGKPTTGWVNVDYNFGRAR